jgi:uncharacterized protein
MHNSAFRALIYSCIVSWTLLTACGAANPPAGAAPTQGAQITTPALADAPTASQTPIPPSPRLSPTPTETLTSTPLPTPTPTLEPMSIAALRQGSYPGSDITIEQELAPGSNYHRYYASYRSEGLKIYALLTVPEDAMPPGGWPAIVFNHGYIPPKQYRTTERYIAYMDWLARAGYIVFRIDYRGNDRSEGAALGAYGSPGYTLDVLNAVGAIKRYPQANPQKIGMWGHSMGGFLTLRAMVISPDIRAGVIWAGVVGSYPDMLYHWHIPSAGPTPTPIPGAFNWRTRWLDQYGPPEQNPAFWDSVSANAFLGDLSGPLQLHHDTADSEVPYAFSQTLVQEAQAAGKSAELFTYPGDDHNLTNSFGLAMTRTIAFFDEHLK